jgi:hypothetical protein
VSELVTTWSLIPDQCCHTPPGLRHKNNCAMTTAEVSQAMSLHQGSAPELMKTYFLKVLELNQSGKEFPVNLDEIWPLAYKRKEEAVRVLKSSFMEDDDYQVLRKNAENPKGGRPTEVFMLSVECMEFFVAKKVTAVFDVYRTVFHKAMKTVTDQKSISDSAAHAENQIFITKLGSMTIKGYYSNGVLYYSMSGIMKFLGYNGGSGSTYADNYGANNCMKVQDGKVSIWFANMQWIESLLKRTTLDIRYEKISTLYRDLFRIEKGEGGSAFTYHFTDKEILAIIDEVKSFKQKPAHVLSIIDRLMKGAGV